MPRVPTTLACSVPTFGWLRMLGVIIVHVRAEMIIPAAHFNDAS